MNKREIAKKLLQRPNVALHLRKRNQQPRLEAIQPSGKKLPPPAPN